MRKILAVILLTAALALCVHTRANAQAKMTDFSGTWVLDKKKTSDLPPTLESYRLTVTQNAQQLTAETELQGEVGNPGGPAGPGGGRSGRGGFPGGPPGGPPPGGFPGGGPGGGGFPGGSPDGGFSMPKDVVMGMALRMTVPKATYTLDGKETVVQTGGREASGGQPAQGGGSLTFKANWKKDGKVLELQAARKFKTPSGERSLTSKDQWELSGDGKILTVKRSMEMPMGTEQVKLVFIKQ